MLEYIKLHQKSCSKHSVGFPSMVLVGWYTCMELLFVFCVALYSFRIVSNIFRDATSMVAEALVLNQMLKHGDLPVVFSHL